MWSLGSSTISDFFELEKVQLEEEIALIIMKAWIFKDKTTLFSFVKRMHSILLKKKLVVFFVHARLDLCY